jgi:hypothetical protein
METLTQEETVELYRSLMSKADEVVIAHTVPAIDFYEEMEIDGRKIVYFGTEESWQKWKRSKVN